MKKFQKKFLTILLSFLIILTTGQFAFASTTDSSESKILSNQPSTALINYAKKSFERHLSVVSKDLKSFGLEDVTIDDVSLGKPFSLYYSDNDINYNTYYFPIIYENNITALLCVMDENGKFTSVFEKGFASELNDLLQNYNYSFKIFNADGDITAISKEIEVPLSKGLPSNSSKQKSNDNQILKKFGAFEPISSQISLRKKDLKTSIKNSNDIKGFPGNVLESSSIPMDIVQQVDSNGNFKNWCWAATCAGIINYVKGESLTAEDVVVYVKGSAINDGGTWSDMKKAYNHWGLQPYETGTMPYWQVKDKIDANSPIHLKLDAGSSSHSVTLKGYEKYSGSNVVYTIIDPNKSYTVSIDVNDNNRGSAYYPMNGKPFYWVKSRAGF